MYIGACKNCREYCQQDKSASFERIHAKQKHNILDIRSFSQDNSDYIYKIQKTWHYFGKELQKFFKALRNKIDTIQSEARQRVKEQQLKTAVNSNDKRLVELSRDIFNQKFKNLTCKEINQFLQIKADFRGSSNFPQISTREEIFAFDVFDEIKRAIYELGKSLTEVKRREERVDRRQTRNYNQSIRQEDTRQYVRDNRQFHNKKDKAEIIPQQDKINRQRTAREQRKPRQDRAVREQRRPRQDGAPRRARQDQNIRRQGRQQRRPRQERQDRRVKIDIDQRKPRQKRQENRQRKGQHKQRNYHQRRQEVKHQKEKSIKSFPKLKIIDLKNDSDEFSIDLKLIELLKVVRERDVWRVRDETGEIRLFIPSHQTLKNGTNITLNNVYVKEHENQLQIIAKLYSTITSLQLGTNIDVGSFAKKNPRLPRPKPSGQVHINFVKINDLEPETQNIKMMAKVISVTKRGQFMHCVIGDETGIVNAVFKSGAQLLKQDNTIYCRGLKVELTQTGNIFIAEGNKFIIQNARQQIRRTKDQNDVSEREYEALDQ